MAGTWTPEGPQPGLDGGGGRAPRSASKRALLTLVDQGFSSASNFGVGVAVARIAGPAGLGGFSLAYACWLFLAAQHRSLVTDPMAIENDVVHREASSKLRAGLAAELILAITAAGVLALVGASLILVHQHIFGLSMLTVAPWLPFLVVQDYWRWIGFMQRRPGKALANDTVFNCVQAAGFAAVAMGGVHSVVVVISSWGIGAAAGAVFGLRQFAVRPTLRGGITLLGARWHMSKWLAGNSLTGWGSTQAGGLLASFILGPVGLGGLRAAQTLVAGPTFVLVQAGGSVGLPEASRALSERGWPGLRRVALFVTGGGLLGIGVVGVLVMIMGGPLLRFVYGPDFARYWAAADLIAVAYLFTAIGLGPVLILKASRRTRDLFRVQVITMVAALSSVTVLALRYGVAGAAGSAIITAAVALTGCLWYCRSARSELLAATTTGHAPSIRTQAVVHPLPLTADLA
ncbi:MAG TPA: hypothetical protein VK386_02555 [Acidimicrobiales bacterium]|nr:hypothetical protein [Acidimicrobiales bacterium]